MISNIVHKKGFIYSLDWELTVQKTAVIYHNGIRNKEIITLIEGSLTHSLTANFFFNYLSK